MSWLIYCFLLGRCLFGSIFFSSCSLFLLFSSHHLFKFIFVLLSENASPLLSFGDKIVTCSQIIEPIFLDVRLTLIQINIVIFLEEVHDLLIYWYLVPSNDNTRFFLWHNLIVPWMSSDILNCKSISRIWVQNAIDQIFGFFT